MIKLKQYLKIDGVIHCPGEVLSFSVDREKKYVDQGIAEPIIGINIANKIETEDLKNEKESNLESEESDENPLQDNYISDNVSEESNDNTLEDVLVTEESKDFLNFDEEDLIVPAPQNNKKK